MMAGNPNRWNMENMHPQLNQQYSPGFFSSPSASSCLFSPDQEHVSGSSSSSLPSNIFADHDHNNQVFPHSLSQLLLGGLAAEEEIFDTSSNFHSEKLEIWRDQQELNPSLRFPAVIDVKKEVTQRCSQLFVHGDIDDETQSNSTANGGVSKKARVNSSSNKPPLKVRKLGDRITALHQLVSPFGKTDTASVLFEAIGYIRFLQGQIEALSSPYLGSSVSASMRYQSSVQEERNCVFSEGNGQFLNDSCLKKRRAYVQDIQDQPKDLRSRGLCLVPVSCTNHVNIGNYDNIGADYWAPSLGGGF